MINIYNIFVRMKCRGYLLVFCVFFSCSFLKSQTPVSYNSSEIVQQLRKLKVLGAVLYVAAHPDDENTRLLSWLSRDQLLRTGYLSLTRGDGGQNLIGQEQGIELGLIRTQELLAARRIDGAEQFFSRAFDFGFSKSTEEALKIWHRDKVIADAVWVIRRFRPDVIITRFPPDARAGHGHHSASAVVAKEAFRLAADPRAFPEQFKYGVEPWQAKRIFWNNYNFGGNDNTSDTQLKIDVGGYNPYLGKSYGEIAAESRSQHKSQGFGVPASRGSQTEYFSLTDGSGAKNGLMDGVDQAWSRASAPGVSAAIDAILQKYSLSDPSASLPALVSLYRQISALPEGYWRNVKLGELQQIIRAAAGLWLEAATAENYAVQGADVKVNFNAIKRSGGDIVLKSVRLEGMDTTLNAQTELNQPIEFSRNVAIPSSKPFSQPYWLAEPMNGGSFNVSDQTLIGKAQSDPSLQAVFDVVIAGQSLLYTIPVMYKHTDPVKGEIYQPLVIVPPVTVSVEPDIVLKERGRSALSQMIADVADNRRDKSEKISLVKQQDTATGNLTARAELLVNGEKRVYTQNIHRIAYDHIPAIHYFRQDAVKLLDVNLKTAGKKIGYIEGAGDKLPADLALMGYQVTILTEKDIVPALLSQFDAVIAGIRAYNVNDWLEAKNEVLNQYVEQGGNYIVQYNTNSNAGPNRSSIGPYPFRISRDRVTDESSPVRFLLPKHAVFHYPNEITQKDFEGWVQERGIYFATDAAPQYAMPLGLKDPGEEEARGSLIIAQHGKGVLVYTGLVFFRELPAAVPGAYRLLANIIALNKSQSANP